MSEHDNPLIDVLNQLNEQKNAAPGNALAHPSDSFPVLKAFNEYLEAERRKMRQRTTLVIACTAGVCLFVLVPLIVFAVIQLAGMNTTQNRMLDNMETSQSRMLDTTIKFIEKENRPIPAPEVPQSVAREFERNVAEEIRRAVADVKREIKSEITAEQNAGFAKSEARLQELQAQQQQVGDEMNKAMAAQQEAIIAALSEKIEAAAPPPAPVPMAATVASPQGTPQVSTSVIPVPPRENFPELASVVERNNQLLSQPAQRIPLDLPPGLVEVPPPPPIPVATPRPVTPIAAPQDLLQPLKLEFVNTSGALETPAVLSIPSPDGSMASWKLVIPGGN